MSWREFALEISKAALEAGSAIRRPKHGGQNARPLQQTREELGWDERG